MIVYGRSDAVLNPGGVRIGTAEIYRQVEKIDDKDAGAREGGTTEALAAGASTSVGDARAWG